MEKFKNRLDGFFGIKANGSTIATEITAGLTTFFAMCYILVVNPGTIVGMTPAGVPNSSRVYNGVFIATALSAFIGTLLFAFWAKLPFAQASGMGLNAFFFVSFVLPVLLTPGTTETDIIAGYQRGLAIILLSGLLFIILSISGIRKKIVESLPVCLKKSIPAGIGLFIALIGMKNAGLVEANPYTFVQLGDISVFVNGFSKGGAEITSNAGKWYAIVPILVCFIGLMVIAILSHKKVKGAIIIGILVSTILFYLGNIKNEALFAGLNANNSGIGQAFRDFGQVSFGRGFVGFKNLFGFSAVTVGAVFSTIMLVITFTLVDMFDTLGTLQGTATEAGMLDEEGNPIRLGQALMCDSTATVAGAVLGTSTVTTYVESSAGVAEGGRTGLTSVVTAACFLIGMFFVPLAKYVPEAATAPALIYVGVLMLRSFKEVEMSEMTSAVPAFLTLIMMPLTFSISNGIALGMISYTILTLLSGKFKKKDIIVAVLSVLFIVKFLFVRM